jgi:hypothetical protein
MADHLEAAWDVLQHREMPWISHLRCLGAASVVASACWLGPCTPLWGLNYSVRKAHTGSTDTARFAGKYMAAPATNKITPLLIA